MTGPQPFLYQLENWIWFGADVLMMFLLFRAIPGVNGFAAGFAALLFGLHPATADTVNYVLQRGIILGTFGVVSGLAIFIYWPWRLPKKLPLKLKRVPEHGLDEFLSNNYHRLESIYLKMIHAPSGLYLWPVVPALLVEPATAVFAPLLAVYIALFEHKRKLRNAIPAAIVCGVYWIFQLILTWKLGDFRRTPAANYLFTQPWVALRYMAKFLVPVNLTADTDLSAFAHWWDPLALAGFAGVALLAGLAVTTGRSAKWRAVSFGIWWFLIAMLPDAIRPQSEVEAPWRMFLPFVGLALAVAGLASVVVEALPQAAPRKLIPAFGAGTLGIAVLAVLGWGTYRHSEVWDSEAALWRSTMEISPHNGRAIMRYGLTQVNVQDAAPAIDYLRRAVATTPHDPLIEISLAKTLERNGRSAEAESQFRNAIADGSSWSRGYAAYSDWLLAKTRTDEAQQMAKKALDLDPYDNTARRTLMDVFAQNHQWEQLKQFAADTLKLEPGDPDGERSLEVAQSGLDHIEKTERAARYEPTVNNFLALSVEYFNSHRYGECIDAAKEVLKINPNQAEAYANLASAYHTLGKLDESIAALREELRLNPNLPNAKTNLEVVTAELVRRDGAKRPDALQTTSGPKK
jgi:protein O-mannosyl-transferase